MSISFDQPSGDCSYSAKYVSAMSSVDASWSAAYLPAQARTRRLPEPLPIADTAVAHATVTGEQRSSVHVSVSLAVGGGVEQRVEPHVAGVHPCFPYSFAMDCESARSACLPQANCAVVAEPRKAEVAEEKMSVPFFLTRWAPPPSDASIGGSTCATHPPTPAINRRWPMVASNATLPAQPLLLPSWLCQVLTA